MNTDKLPIGWTRVRLGDVVEQIKDRVDFSAESTRVYVPGGSIGRGNFKIAEWLPVDDGLMGPAFHMVCRSGDVLYKSRVPHGVGVADRSGICANTTYVLRTRDESVLLQDLLPYLLSTDLFLNHESLNDKGSTNLYLNFSDIAKYEFALPPIGEQQRIVELVSAADGAIGAYSRLRSAQTDLRDTVLLDSIWDDSQKNWRVPTIRVGDLLAEPPRNGVSPPASPEGEGTLTVSISAVQHGRFVPKPAFLKWCRPVGDPSGFVVRTGDAFAVRGNGNRSLVGRLGLCDETPQPEVLYPDLLIRLRFDPGRIDPVIATAIWNLRRVHEGLLGRAKSSNGIYKVNGQDISNHRLPVPTRDTQRDLLRRLVEIDRVGVATEASFAAAVQMRQSLLNIALEGNPHVQ